MHSGNDRRRPLFVGGLAGCNRHLLDDSFTQARLSEQREELSLQMIVSLATNCAGVVSGRHPKRNAIVFRNLERPVPGHCGSHFVGGVTVALITDVDQC
jgi:hypothetical protein